MTLERQRQILKEKHGRGTHILSFNTMGPDLLVVYDVSSEAYRATGDSTPRFRCCAYLHKQDEVFVHSSRMDPRFRPRTLHNFVAAVTYAKAELARIERLNAAKENQ